MRTMTEDRTGNPSQTSVEQDRPTLMGVAYRMLGTTADAENAVQEAYVRWYGLTDERRHEVRSPTGWLVRTVSRICLDLLGSARARRERYVGEWLPEPVPGGSTWTTHHRGGEVDPVDRVTLDESVTMALLVVLDTMTPAERVVFVLRDVFGHPFAEISEIVGRSPAACRQLATSARRRVIARRGPGSNRADHAGVVEAFTAAWQTGDLTALVALLDPDALVVTDGGGLVSAPGEPTEGADPVARFLLDVLARQPDLVLEPAAVNERPGVVARSSTGDLLAVVAVAIGQDGAVERLWTMRSPTKLAAWD
jgi:RNA polymerase sigma-70 factor (ECF subfamily)